MIKRKLNANKQALVNTRLYTVISNNHPELSHGYLIGEVVTRLPCELDDDESKRYKSLATGLEQYVMVCEVI